MKKRGICAALSALFVCASLVPGMQAQAAEKAGQFMDCFLPMPIVDENGLSEDCWGAQEVGPRDQSNGLEDPLIGVEGAEGTRYCYWDGAIIKDDVTGKYYMFASKWKESDGHWGWPGSQAVYATSDNLYGPYEEQGLMWPEYENSYGHNVFPFELKDGEMFNGKEMRYAVVLGDTNRDGLQGGIFVSDSLDGPWNFTGQMEVHQDEKMKDEETDGYFHLSNISIVLTPENTYIACNREGDIAVSDSVFGPWEVVNQNIWNQIPGLAGHGDVEDPVIWYADGLYHCVVNRWDAKYAFYLTSENGIDQWRVHSGTAYRPGEDFLRYEDGTVNKWTKIERPNVYIEDGEVKAMTLSVIDVEKEVEYGNDSHGSKIIVVPFDNEALRSLRDCPSEILDREGIPASADTDVQSWSYEAGSNYGDRKYVRVMNHEDGGLFGENVTGGGSDDCKIGYVRFSLDGQMPEALGKAELSMVYYKNLTSDVDSGRIRVALADSQWTEGVGDEWNDFDSSDGGVTWNSKPQITYRADDPSTVAYSSRFDATENLRVVTVDVTSLLQNLAPGTKEVTFAITGEDGHQFSFASKEFGTGYEPKLFLTADKEEEPDYGELKASFHLVSDVHISDWSGENTKTYIAGMKFMSTLNTDSNIGFVNAGDFTNNSQKSEFNAFFVTTRQYNPVSPDNTLILLGNHDVRGTGSDWNADPNGSFPYWDTAKGLYTSHNRRFMPAEAQDTLYHAKELGGYTFLMLNTELGLKDSMYMSEEQLAWFEAQMKACYEEDPTKPVFIICHQALNDTHMRSNVLDGFDGINGDGTPNDHYTGSDAKVKEIMAKYPVGVFLSGHIHNGLGYGEAVAREYGVCIDLPSYNGSENGYTEKGAGFEVMIYENQIVFEAYNFSTGERLEEYDLVVDSPTVSALYQKAAQEVTRTDLYTAEQIAALQSALDAAKPLLNQYYDQRDLAWDDASEPEEFFYHPDDWQTINAAAEQLRTALNGLKGE